MHASSLPSLLIVAGIIFLIVVGRIVALRATVDRRLLSVCLGNRDQAQRLIEFELRRNPKISRQRAAALALSRIRRDNH